ncbi:MAG TPA: hypothetical protein VM347_25630 [Nonomuraea sp.]|nr:hypothetical protein [Nonomuraea sp.]
MNDNILICLLGQNQPQPAVLRACRPSGAAGKQFGERLADA